MDTRRCAALAARLFVLVVGCAAAPGASALYTGMFAIGDFVPGSSGGCGGDDRPSWPGMANAWYQEMGAKGHFKAGSWTDGNMTIQRFCDASSFNGGCQDAWPYFDWMDAAIIATHGWDDGDHWGGLMRYPWNGECGLRVGGSSNMGRWGDSWVLFAHLSSCFSANKDDLGGIPSALEDLSTSSSRRGHQWDGFHGIMWISSSFNNDYKETAKDGHSSSVAYSWVTNHYKNDDFECAWYDSFGWFGTCRDQCPVAVAIGNSAGDALTRLHNERYNFTYSDPSDNTWYAWMAYTGCHPVGKGPF
jgi:hypothetical protein